TPRLWGVARSGPWLHDGRAPTLDRAIVEHSGEASAAARAYEALSDAERAPIRIYLTSLTRVARVIAP
ncbi:MAG TPA: thiol oxidoreductase, partial [Polyangiaceae bacterium]|nr:thiol oxidoreductase [Polyangiaceae bacterium]